MPYFSGNHRSEVDGKTPSFRVSRTVFVVGIQFARTAALSITVPTLYDRICGNVALFLKEVTGAHFLYRRSIGVQLIEYQTQVGFRMVPEDLQHVVHSATQIGSAEHVQQCAAEG